ncbi:glycosyltransferase family 2 protein [Congregibacter sp.]|uniref:glycosyltransferase family 2 protein n=1 Tax=Congregibacter sp. TaxID=2744308 RepID=UPI003F6C8E77
MLEPAAAVPTRVSIVVPMYNEQSSISSCHDRLRATCEIPGYIFEYIYVDDGSTDESVAIIRRIQRSDSQVKLLVLSRNFGKEVAMSAGLDYASGEAVIVTDADLQDPPELIPLMLAQWRKGAQVVCMRRRSRAGESWLKKTLSHAFYRLLNRLSDIEIPQDVGDFRLMSRRAVDAVKALPERNRYMKGVFAWIGFSPVFLDYDREPRCAGGSKWGMFSLLGLAVEGITSFSVKPLRWVMWLGLLTAAGGFSFGLWIVGNAVLVGNPVAGYPSMVALMTFGGGVQLFSLGLLGVYVGKSYTESKQRPLYLVQEFADPQELAIPITEALYVQAVG